MKNTSYKTSTTATTKYAAGCISSCFLTRLALAAVALVLFMLPIAGQACCGIGPQYPDFHDDSPSQNDPYVLGPIATAFENFTAGGSGGVTGVTWWGSYSNPALPAPILDFTIDFYSSSGNAPGSLLSSFIIAGNANETFVQYDDLGDPTYRYNAALTLTVAAGTEYWMSIVPDLAYPPHGDGKPRRRAMDSLTTAPLPVAATCSRTWHFRLGSKRPPSPAPWFSSAPAFSASADCCDDDCADDARTLLHHFR